MRTHAAGECFHSFFEFSQTFTGVLYLDRNTENMFSVSFIKHRDEKKGKQLLYFDHKNVNSLYSRHHYVNSSCWFSFSTQLQKHDFFKNWFMLSVRISSYGRTQEVGRARKKRKSCSRRSREQL